MKWGILATGNIARNFAKTVSQLPDVTVQAVASRNAQNAEAFAAEFGIPAAYGSYEALASDPQVDIVYVATPHSRHYEDVKLLLEHGKHVLCEKSFTTDAGQAEALFALAREKGVFLMEAFWTKCLPIYRHVEKWIAEGKIGEIRTITAQYGYNTPRIARKFDAGLAGGTLLDIGVYAIGFACLIAGYEWDSVQAQMIMNDAGTDAVDSLILRRGDTVAQLSTSIGSFMPILGMVYGTKGHIEVPEFKNPKQVTLCVDGEEPQVLEIPFEVNGFECEIREAQRCAEQGLAESPLMTAAQSIATMRIMDEARRQCGLVFPFEK